MKKVYVSPSIDIADFKLEDVITTSGGFDANQSGTNVVGDTRYESKSVDIVLDDTFFN